MDLFKPEGSGETCCFCGERGDPEDAPVLRLWLELPSAGRNRLMREHRCHERCFQAALAPPFRAGSGRPVQWSPDGVILNAADLTPDDLVHRRVLCPACGAMTFALWPEGWDAHAAHRCAGVRGDSAELRKADFRSRFGRLFRHGVA